MIAEFFTSSASGTQKTGAILAEEVVKNKSRRQAALMALVGDLGGGKTTFLQGFARGLGIKEKVLSPTFIIMRRLGNFYHFDCYRVQKTKELLGLGFKKIITNPKNIVAIEWADKVKKIIPQNAIWLRFEFIDKNKRKIVVKSKDAR